MRETEHVPPEELVPRPGDRHEGQGLVEYGLIIALVVVLAIAGLIIFGPSLSSLLSGAGPNV